MRRSFLVVISVLVAACATQQQSEQHPTAAAVAAAPAAPAAAPATVKATSAAELLDRAGDSVETAIAVPVDAPNEGIDFENNWIFDRYGRFRRVSWGVGHAGEREIKTIKIELPDHSMHTVFFDVTEQWKAWKPPADAPPPPH